MIVLWDSADMNVSLTLVAGTVRYDYQWQANRSLARDMLAYLRDRLAEHQATLDDVTGIGVYRGPGSFTGLRIGLTVLNTLAETNHVPIVGSQQQIVYLLLVRLAAVGRVNAKHGFHREKAIKLCCLSMAVKQQLQNQENSLLIYPTWRYNKIS